MKGQALLIFLVLAFGVLVSPSLLPKPSYLDQAAFEYSGIERSTNLALAIFGDMPCLNQCPCKPFPLSLNNASEVVRPLFLSFLFTYQEERPPKS
jgi:hypothetical protein